MKPIHQNPRFLAARLSLPFATALVALFNLTTQSASAVNLFWDTNGDTAGSGAATGTWGIDPFWSTNSAGTIATANTTTTGVDELIFSAGSGGTSGNVTVNGAQTAQRLIFEDGAITFSGGSITLAGGNGIFLDTSAGNTTVSTALTVNGNNSFNLFTGRMLTLDNTGAFTRGTRATLNIQGTGTVTSTKTGLATGDMVNGIVGPWASFGIGAATTYARFDGSDTIGGLLYTGGAEGESAAASTDVITGAGNLNYSLGVAGTLGTSASINTLRYTGAAGALATATSFTTRGIMNSGTGLLTFSNAVTSGANTTELVVNTANNDITFSGVLTGTLIKTGSGTMTLGNANHILGGITVNQGILITNRTTGDTLPSATINSGGTLRYGVAGKFNNTSVITINAGGTLNLNGLADLIGGIAGAGLVTSPSNVTFELQGNQTFAGQLTGGIALQIRANGDQTFSGLSTYTRATQIGVGGTAGTLRINSIRDVNTGASAIGNPSNATNGTISMGSAAANGTLVYTGAGHSSNRLFQIGTNSTTPGVGDTGGAIIQADGASNAALTFTSGPFNAQTNAATGVGADRTLTLQGSSTGLNTISGEIRNNVVSGTATGTARVGVTKAGTGTWVLSGPNTYTGTTTVSTGTLKLGVNDCLPDTSAVSIAVGTLDVGTFSDTAGTLDVTAAATITVGTGGALAFADSAGVDWTGGTLNVTGTLGATSLRFGTSATGLTAPQLASISINGTPGASLNPSGYLIAASDPYLAWAGAGVPFDGDANNDGVQNGLAWLLGAPNPNDNANDLMPAVTQAGGSLQMTFSMLNAANRGSAGIRVQQSSDLGISDPWADSALVPDTAGVSPEVNGVTFNVTLSNTPKTNSVIATVSSAEAAGGKLFGRLKGVQ